MNVKTLTNSFELGQKLVLSTHFLQSIKILAMSRVEIEALIVHEFEENPILDQAESVSGLTAGFSEFADVASPEADIRNYLVGQLAEIEISEDEKKVAVDLIGNIDDDGYLDVSIEDFSQACGIEVTHALRILDRIQHLNPPGVGARDLQECLLLQLEALHLEDSLAGKIVSSFFKEMQAHQFARIASALRVGQEEVIECVNAVRELNPRPASNFGPANVSYAIADVYVSKNGDEWEIGLGSSPLPKLCINEQARRIYEKEGSGVPKEYLKSKLDSARVLMRALEERHKTVLVIAQAIVDKQNAFLENGFQHLAPMRLSDIARETGMSESTVSRAVNNKYIATPHGTFEMKRFFAKAIATESQQAVSSASVRAQLAEFVRLEDKRAPVSDTQIAQLFLKRGIRVARRTVAKYREQLGILPAAARKTAKKSQLSVAL